MGAMGGQDVGRTQGADTEMKEQFFVEYLTSGGQREFAGPFKERRLASEWKRKMDAVWPDRKHSIVEVEGGAAIAAKGQSGGTARDAIIKGVVDRSSYRSRRR